jgi:sugar phosphate isomerase/epimerase
MILGAQLYTVRSYLQTETDIRRTLKKIAEMGYTSIQLSALGKIALESLKDICDELSLRIVLTHVSPERLLNETDIVIKEHEVLGCEYIGIGSMPEKYRTVEWFGNFAADFREPAKRIADSGKLFMYHHHNFEFAKIGGKRMIERLIEDFPASEMGITLDTYWVQAAGADLLQWIDILRDRIHCVHLKDMDVRGMDPVMAPVMEGNMDFPAIMKALQAAGTTKFALVEQDICEGSPFDCLQTSYQNLSSLGYR